MRLAAACAALALLLDAGLASALEFKPQLEAEGRWFYQAEEAPLLGSAAATLELFHDWDEGQQRIVGEGFARYDDNDGARTHGDVRELYYQVIGDDFEFRLGARRVYWGVTESRHLVDIINQTDFVEDIDSETKLGQPMMNLALIRELGTLDLFLMPYQRARTFPGVEGYPRLPLPVHAHEARYQSRREQTHLDYALRYVNSFGPLDIGLAWFDGTAREPRLLPCLQRGAQDPNGDPFPGTQNGPNCDLGSAIPDPGVPEELIPLLQALGFAPDDEAAAQAFFANLVLVPHYDRLRQASIDAQVVIGSLALKLEGVSREQQARQTWAGVAGFEYTFGDVWATGADVGVLAEYLYDEREDLLTTLFDDELFVGGRLSLNDIAGSQLLAGVIASRERFDHRLYGIEASRRLTDEWRLSLESRIFSEIPADAPAAFFADQDFVTLTLERFF